MFPLLQTESAASLRQGDFPDAQGRDKVNIPRLLTHLRTDLSKRPLKLRTLVSSLIANHNKRLRPIFLQHDV